MRESWEWQLQNAVQSTEQLTKYINLTDEREEQIEKVNSMFSFLITPYYASLMDRDSPECSIQMQAVPSIQETIDNYGEKDPLKETNMSPVPLIVHVYPDRVAFLVSDKCATYCRHCLRKYTKTLHSERYTETEIRDGIEYIKGNKHIRDVLLTGGDPFLLSDEKIEWILAQLRSIPHVEIIRFGTRTVCTLPQRITDNLCRILRKYHPIWLNTQFNHPKELTEEVHIAIEKLLNSGVPVGNQSVLLKGINDSTEIMKELLHKLVFFRIRPYYLYQAQLLYSTEHFITPIEKGISIMKNIQGYTSGLCEPRYVLDTPYGKIPIGPQYVLGREDDYFVLRTYNDIIWKEYNPTCRSKTTGEGERGE